MSEMGDVRRPREQTPAFFGCFDWHSAVHGHWTLVRLARCFPEEAWAKEAVAALRQSLTDENLQLELKFMSKSGREGFERPYGLAWLLQLAAELREWDRPAATGDQSAREGEAPAEPQLKFATESTLAAQRELRPPVGGQGFEIAAREMLSAIHALEQHCRNRLAEWLPKLTRPIRSGEHSQTAFAIRLKCAHSVTTGDLDSWALCVETARRFYLNDRELPVGFEPSGHDFFSPSLAEADLMRVVLQPEEFGEWLGRALPHGFPHKPVVPSDRVDGKLAHLDGLNLSRAWMLEGIASALPEDDPRKATFERQAAEHAEVGLASVTGEHYAGGHWLGTFATYLMTRRGIDQNTKT